MKARERKLGLRKRTCCGHHRNSSVQSSFPCGPEQGGLADSSLPANDEGAAVVLDAVYQRVELYEVSIASEKRRWRGCDSFGIWARGAYAHPSWSGPLDDDSNLQ